MRPLVLLSTLSLSMSGLAAQTAQFGLQGEAASTRIGGLTGGEPLRADLFGGRGSVAFGPVQLSVVYHEGRLRGAPPPSSASIFDILHITTPGSASSPRVIEGSVLAKFRLVPALAVGVGPHGRAYVSDAVTLHRIWGAGSINVEVPLLGPGVRTFLGLSRSFVTRRQDSLTSVTGGEVGIALGAPSGWNARLATRFDDAVFTDGRHERLVGLMLAGGFGL